MNLNQFTLKSQEAIQKAQQGALEFGNQSIEPQHLFFIFTKKIRS